MTLWVADNLTPFAVDRGFVRDVNGGELWVVVVRATFQVENDGTLVLAQEQLPVSRAPAYCGAPGSSSLLFDSDFPITKHGTDVILHGHAWAPGRRAAPLVDVGMQVGPMRKQLRVYGTRTWQNRLGTSDLAATQPEPFLKSPITYEDAWGGKDPKGNGYWASNPVGRGYANEPASLVHTELPSVEDPLEPLTQADAEPRKPAGFGAIAPHWPQRTRYAGTYDTQWQRERAPLWPNDFDVRFFHVAPDDQQVHGFLQGGEHCELHNLTSDGKLSFALPRNRIVTTTHFIDREEQRSADLHLVLLEPDLRRVQLVWHMALDCHAREHLIRRTRIRCEGERIPWARQTPSQDSRPPSSDLPR